MFVLLNRLRECIDYLKQFESDRHIRPKTLWHTSEYIPSRAFIINKKGIQLAFMWVIALQDTHVSKRTKGACAKRFSFKNHCLKTFITQVKEATVEHP